MESFDHTCYGVEKLKMTMSVALAILFFCVSSNAQDSLKIVRTETAPKVDGILTEGEWDNAQKAVLEKQYEPQENAAATERTEVLFLYDKDNLYIAFHAFDSDPTAIRAPVSKRDDIALDDKVEIWLDTFDDRRRTYAFRFNPLGIQEDGIFTDGDFGNLNWDGILTSKGSITNDGYVVEVAIPFKTLRYQINKDKRWGMHLFRRIARKQENTTWMPISRNRESFLIQMGSLEGLDGIETSRTLDIIPTVTLSRNGMREVDPTVPFGARFNEVNKLDIGVTATYAITPNLILSATVNPDFSQVEADVPQVSVNQRFPLFFAEKRPFFLEGAEVFRSFYSAAPRIIDTRQIVDPDWGIKLTGKIGKNTIGFLSASDRAPGLRVQQSDDNFGENAQFNIFRYGRDVFKQSSIGFSLTDRRFAGSVNTVGTFDGRIRFGNDKQLFAYQLSYSKTKDVDGTKREGSSIYLVYNYEDRKWDFGTSQSGMARNFRAQTGFIRRTGFLRSYGYIGRTFRPKEKSWWVKVRPFVVALAFRDERGNFDETFVDPGLDLGFARGINLYTYFSTTRDNFLGTSYTTRQYVARWSVLSFEKISASGVFRTGTGVNFDPSRPELGDLLENTLNITVKPINKLNSEFLWLRSSLTSRTGGDKLFAQDIYRNRTVYQFNRFNAIRSIVDYDTFSRRVGVSLLYGYTPRPNTAIYIGYGDAILDGIDPLNGSQRSGLTRESRTFFAKFSYNYRF